MQTKIDAPRLEATYCGQDDQRNGCFVYVGAWKRFTTVRLTDCIFYETEYPNIDGVEGSHTDKDNALDWEPRSMSSTFQDDPLPMRTLRKAVARGAAPTTDVETLSAGCVPLLTINDPFVPALDAINDDDVICFNLDAVGPLPTPPISLKQAKADGREDYNLWEKAARKDYLEKIPLGCFRTLD